MDIKELRNSVGNDQDAILATLQGIDFDPSQAPETIVTNDIQEATFDRAQVIQACEADLNFLGALALPELFEFHFPPVLLAAWQLLKQYAVEFPGKFPQVALGIPRGHAKTTLIKLFILYCIIFTKKRFILVICSTAPLAENIIADVTDMLDEDNCKSVFGDWRVGIEKNTNNLKKFGFRGRNIILGAVGAEGSIRGLNIKNARPDVMIFEDIQTKECAESPVQSLALERWMIGTAMKAKSPRGCLMVFVGNMYPGPNSILKKIKHNPKWVKFISGAILADGTALWEELRSLESLIEELETDMASGHPEIFFSEVLNDTEAGINNSIDFSKFMDWPWLEEDIPQGKFIIVDPSQGKGMDSDAIAYCEVYDGRVGVKEIVTGKYSPGNLIRRVLILALATNTRFIAVEAMAYQFTLLYWFDYICQQLGITGLVLCPMYANSHSKNSRIVTGLKALGAGEIVLHKSCKALVQNQIANWNPLKRDNVDDLIDVIAYAPKVISEHATELDTVSYDTMVSDGESSVVEDNHCF